MAIQLGERAGVAIGNARLYDEAMRAVRLNDMFAGVVGHDLRNPLSSIMSAAQLMLMRGARESDRRPLERIVASSERMARMIDQLLDFTRIRAGGGIPCDRQQTEFAPVARQVIQELRDSHPDRDIRFEERGNLSGFWDPDRLGQLLSNLVSNAIQHGNKAAPVSIDADGVREDVLIVRVSNDGAIAESLVAVIFEPFRGTTYKRHHNAGLGLGLHIAQQIAVVHEGTLELVTSDHGRTMFVLTLPRSSERPIAP